MPKTKDLDEEIEDEDEDVEDETSDVDLNLQDLEFHQFMQPTEINSSPVLEKITGSMPSPIFVGGMSQTSRAIPGEEEKADDFKYVSSNSTNEEPKYLASDSHITQEMNQLDFREVGRGRPGVFKETNQQNFINQFSEGKQNDSSTVERARSIERFDSEKTGREEPFGTIDKRKYKPGFVSSR